MVIKDKVFVGISGGEFGIRGSMTEYDMKTGKQAWRAYSVGPDDEMLIDAQKTTELGKPVGSDSSLKAWQGDQWMLGGSTSWGWYSYDPELNLVSYGSANPGTWNPSQRPGDNKWSMTIFARNVDTGIANWVYQMTPHDQWDYGGVNEMILVDQTVNGTQRKILVHFDRNGFAYTLDRATSGLLVAEKYDPTVNWATKIDMDKAAPTYGRPIVDAKYATQQLDVNVGDSVRLRWERRTSNRRRFLLRPACSTCQRITSAWILRGDRRRPTRQLQDGGKHSPAPQSEARCTKIA